MTYNNRLGKFKISKEIILNNYELVNKVLSNVVVVECNQRFDNVIEYVAISPLFDTVADGCRVNDYQIVINDGEIEFIKLDEGKYRL